MSELNIGPFTFERLRSRLINGQQLYTWGMSYGSQLLSEKSLPMAKGMASGLQDAFEDERVDFVRSKQPNTARARGPLADGYRIRLVESTDVTGCEGKTLDSFLALAPIPGISRGLIDDRFETWAVSDELGNTPMGADEFARLKEAHAAIADALTQAATLAPPSLRRGWIAGLLPDDVLSTDAETWRPPTSWELRHVVGEGSFTGISGARAAALVGVLPQNFRKYTAADGASSRQKMSFAMWHLLLHKLDVQRLEVN